MTTSGLFGAGFNPKSDKLAARNVPELSEALQKNAVGLSSSAIVDLDDLTANPDSYDFFTFRPNLKKLILSGSADTEHICILWYMIPDGRVGRHYHSMTESVYTIEGKQTDAKGMYPTGSLYFNLPGSGHEISESTGFFILAYASPPEFKNTELTEEYSPVQINTADSDLETIYPFENKQDGVWTYDIPLNPQGGMRSQFIKSTSSQNYRYEGNYLLVLRGSCNIDGTTFHEKTLVVATATEPQFYEVSAAANHSCLLLGLAFLNVSQSCAEHL